MDGIAYTLYHYTIFKGPRHKAYKLGPAKIPNPLIQSNCNSVAFMLQTFVIALREGVEAALVIAIAVAYLRKTGRQALLSSVYKAFGAAVFASILVAAILSCVHFSEEAREGPLLLVSAVFVFSMVLWMNRHARGMKSEIE